MFPEGNVLLEMKIEKKLKNFFSKINLNFVIDQRSANWQRILLSIRLLAVVAFASVESISGKLCEETKSPKKQIIFRERNFDIFLMQRCEWLLS